MGYRRSSISTKDTLADFNEIALVRCSGAFPRARSFHGHPEKVCCFVHAIAVDIVIAEIVTHCELVSVIVAWDEMM